MSEVLENATASWPEVFVSDVSELIRGVTYSKEHATDKPQDGYTPVLRATNIQESRLVLESDLVFVPDSNVSANQRLRAGDIVVATSSGSKHLVGKSGLVHADWRGSFGAFCAAIRPKPNIESRFLAAFLQSPSYWKQVGKKALGVNINNLRRGDIESLTLPLPPLATQREIVAELEKQFSRLDEAVANLQRVKANLKRYKASVLKAAVEGRLVETEATLARREGRTYETGEQLLQRILEERRGQWQKKTEYKEPSQPALADQGDLPVGWAWACVEQLNPGNRPCAYGVLQPGEDLANGVPFVRVGDINDGMVDFSDMKRIHPEIAAAYPRTYLKGGEVLLTLVGAIGRTAVAPNTLAGANVARAVGVLPINESVDPHWVEMWFRNPAKIAEMTGKSHEVARKTLNLEDVRLAAVALPPRSEQFRIVAEVERHLSIIREVEAEVDANLQRAQALRQATLAKAFSI